ncbi:MAG: FGLLP motif-containing membrane protein [Acidimicrobiales bacterium]
MIRGGRFIGVVVILVGAALFGALGAHPVHTTPAGAAQTGLNGAWQCCNAGGASSQVFVMNGGTGTAYQTTAGGEFATITDSDNGGKIKIVTTYTDSSYVATFLGVLATDDQSMSGTWTSTEGQVGTWSATRTTFLASTPITVSLTLSRITFPVGQTSIATVTVTAGSEALTNVSLGTGLTIEGSFVTVTKSPATLGVATLAAGASQSFTFTLKGDSDGGDVISVDATADGATGNVGDTAESKYDVGTFTGAPISNGGMNVPMPAAAPIASTLGTPGEIFHSFGHNLENASITVAAILFITFPASMFNNTFSSNYGEIVLIFTGWRRRVRRAFGLKDKPDGEETLNASLPPITGTEATTGATSITNGTDSAVKASDPDMPGRSSRPWFIAVLALGGILGGLLNPHFGLNSESVSGFGATLVSFVIGASLSWYIAKIFRRHHKYPTHTYLKALPLGLAVAAICVLISRATNFEPGYLYGIVVSIAFVETLEERHNAHLTVISTFSTLAVALLAWFAWVPINHLAGLHTGNIPLGILDDVLGSIFVGGLVGTVIGLMPLQFMPGGALLRWRKDVWAIVFFVALFLLVEVELNPDSGPTHHGGAPIVTAIVLFVGFGGATWMMRRYFIKRGATKKELSPVLATTTATIGPAVVLEPETDEDAEVHD